MSQIEISIINSFLNYIESNKLSIYYDQFYYQYYHGINYTNINFNINLYLTQKNNNISLNNYYYLSILFFNFKTKPNNIYKCNPELNKLIDEYEKEIQITRNKYQPTQRDSAAVSRGGRRKKKVLKQYK